MSLAVRTHQRPEKFDVDRAQFEEIIAPRDERVVISKQREMEKGSGSESHSNNENKKSPRKDTKDYYSSEEESYDDDFESDAGESPRKTVAKNTARKSPSPKRNSLRTPDTLRTKSPTFVSTRSSRKGKPKKRFKPYISPRSPSPATSRLPEKNWAKLKNRSAEPKNRTRLDHTVVDRVLSANRNKVTKLESRLSQLIKELTKEKEENKTLRLIQHRQEKKLDKVIGEEAELPQLLVKHSSEVKSLRERIRRLQDSSHDKDEKLNEQDRTILKLKDKCKYYRDLCEKEELTEKAELEKKISKAEENLKKRDEEISKLQRMLNLKEKTHSRNLKEQKEKLRETQNKLRMVEENCNNLQGKLRVREKQLDYTNIYQRQIVLKEKTISPDSPPKMAALPAPKRGAKNNTNAAKTNGNKAKNKSGFVSKDKEDESKKKNSVFLTAQSDKESGSDWDIDRKKGNKEVLSITDGKNISGSNGATVNGYGGGHDDDLDSSERRRREEFERNLRAEDERLRKEKEDADRMMNEIKEREERERMEREAKWREDSAKKAREAEEKRLASAKRREDERRRNEERIAEERKQEELREREKKAAQNSFIEDEEARRKKDALLARLKAIDSDKGSDEDPLNFGSNRFPNDHTSKLPASKSFQARKADQNLHNGLPSAPRENQIFSPPKETRVPSPVESDPDSVIGVPRHKPVLLGRGGLTKKKDNQLDWLNDDKKPATNKARTKPLDDGFNFGEYSPSVNDNTKKSDGDIFDTGFGRRGGQGRRREGGAGDNVFNFGERQGSGGNEKPQSNSLGFLSDDFGNKRTGEQSSQSLLPRRRAAQERGGPAAVSSAFDDNLDDIEEFTL